jgi:3-oxoacyl-[acyl-carrier-protein] synthase-3
LSLSLKPRNAVRAKISSVGAYVPPRLLTNADLEKMVATNDQWITERTGIRERHLVEPGTPTSVLATEAARICLEKRGIEASSVDAIIVATVTPDMLFPATACIGRGDSISPQPARGSSMRCRSAPS